MLYGLLRPQRKLSRKRLLLGSAIGILIGLPVVFAGVLAYTSSKTTEIAHGLTVGEMDIGGMQVGDARRKIEETWQKPLHRTIRATYRDQDFVLASDKAGVKLNVDAAVSTALKLTRSGNPFKRVWRRITSGRIEENIPVRVGFSAGAVDAFMRQVQGSIDRPATDASLHFSHKGISKRPSQLGTRTQADRLRSEVINALRDPDAPRELSIITEVVRPAVTTDQLATRHPTAIIIDCRKFKLTLFKNLKPKKSSKVTVGTKDYETPAGLHHISDMQKDPVWYVPDSKWAGNLAGKKVPGGDPGNPLKARWIGMVQGVGIHGTDSVRSLGKAASHGCIRMAIKDVKDLYDRVEVGASIYVH